MMASSAVVEAITEATETKDDALDDIPSLKAQYMEDDIRRS